MFGFAPVQPVVPVGLSAGDSWGGEGWQEASGTPQWAPCPNSSLRAPKAYLRPAPQGTYVAPCWQSSAQCTPRARRSVGMWSGLPETNPWTVSIKPKRLWAVLGLRAKLDPQHKTSRKQQARASCVSLQLRMSGMMGLLFCALAETACVHGCIWSAVQWSPWASPRPADSSVHIFFWALQNTYSHQWRHFTQLLKPHLRFKEECESFNRVQFYWLEQLWR